MSIRLATGSGGHGAVPHQRRPRRWAAVTACALLAQLVAAAPYARSEADATAPAPANHTVIIDAMQFKPESLVIHPGDRVTWVNKDLVPHTATAVGKAFDSGSIAPGRSWVYVAVRPGAYPYGCEFHPTMHGTLRIQP